MKKYRILSLDGGGLRGLITTRLLHRLNTESGIRGWIDDVDLFVGTSTGGILALALAIGKTPEDICRLYLDKGKLIFKDNYLDDILDLGKTIGAEYSNKDLKKELLTIFGDITLADIADRYNKKVAIPTF
ncbi:patatin-like phospholipase family protein, partial [bacterium]|nr:patatin-like phospholipase family protein [bacterium]